ncbi:hypothetical protein ABZ565_16535 [Streptomyces sp. NPDC016469]|uniref:hypothetical protein n=1 Tax=Streptomyces sp. NPDC016469 TaxID=3157191 RepID=UPI003400078F
MGVAQLGVIGGRILGAGDSAGASGVAVTAWACASMSSATNVTEVQPGGSMPCRAVVAVAHRVYLPLRAEVTRIVIVQDS